MNSNPTDDVKTEKHDSDSGSSVRTVSVENMKRIGARPPLSEYIRGLLDRRHFIKRESRAKAFGSVRDTALGKVWLILDPFLNSAVYYLIFGIILNVRSGVPNYVGYLVVGVTFFNILSRHVGGAAGIIQVGRSLTKAFSFPKASLVFSFTLRQYIDFIPSIFAALIFIMVVPPHALPTLTWLFLPLILLLGIPFCLGAAFIVATLSARFPDLKFVWPLVTRFWFYGSGVFWSVNRFGPDSIGATVMHWNPGWTYLELMRESLVYDRVPAADLWIYFGLWSLIVFFVGFFFFWMHEEKFNEYN